jgi:hypothetical protein
MSRVSLTMVGAVSAIVTVALFVIGIAMMATSGVQVLIPETGKEGLEWIADVDDAGDLFVVGAWFVVFGGLVGLVALVGVYEALRGAGPAMILAPILGIASLSWSRFLTCSRSRWRTTSFRATSRPTPRHARRSR